ncbi:MAG: DUF4197 domain-containing protein [Sinobacteraceae bacterium]|nr:DUF4197 domain-containing protein [Nevskiaceae bacterium]MCP5470711.1 DUF4197 domain-containing protein [Nevskiaceae bacterium]
MTTALRTALTQGAQAVGKLGVVDGFLGNSDVKIPLPGRLAKSEKLLRGLGLGKQADELVTAMNRAAEAAVPEATVLLIDAVTQMSIQDATAILTGPDDAATRYFQRTTSDKLKDASVESTAGLSGTRPYWLPGSHQRCSDVAGTRPSALSDTSTGHPSSVQPR